GPQRHLPPEDRPAHPGRQGTRRGPALLRLAAGLPEGEAAPALAGRAVPAGRDRARLLPAGQADAGRRPVLRAADRRPLPRPVLEPEARAGGRPRSGPAAPDPRRAGRGGEEADEARCRRQPLAGGGRPPKRGARPPPASRGAAPPHGRLTPPGPRAT